MNIFILSRSPRRAAQHHGDKHVVKMILETAQLLYTAHWLTHPERLHEGAYKKTHANHPCAIWARATLQNYMWLCALGFWLCREYTFRYGKTHKTEARILWLITHPPDLPDAGPTPFAQAMPDEYRHDDPVVAYRTYYLQNKVRQRGIVSYTKRSAPEWT